MSTTKQKQLAKLTLEHPNLPKGELVELGGYGPAIIKTPAKVLNSSGYLAELRSLGLTEEFITKALIADINKKPQKRVEELKLASDILGMRKKGDDDKPTNKIVVGINFIIPHGGNNPQARTDE